LLQFAKEELNLNDDEVEDVVESAFDILDAIADLALKIKEAKKEE